MGEKPVTIRSEIRDKMCEFIGINLGKLFQGTRTYGKVFDAALVDAFLDEAMEARVSTAEFVAAVSHFLKQPDFPPVSKFIGWIVAQRPVPPSLPPRIIEDVEKREETDRRMMAAYGTLDPTIEQVRERVNGILGEVPPVKQGLRRMARSEPIAVESDEEVAARRRLLDRQIAESREAS